MDLGVRAGQRREDGLAQPERLYGAARAHGRDPDRLREQSHLAEAVAAAEHVERHLLTVIALLDDARGAGREHVERIRLVPLADDHGAERKRDELEALGDQRPHIVGEQGERGELADQLARVDDLRDGHARAPGRAARARRRGR